MKKFLFLTVLLGLAFSVKAQDDPVIMTIGGEPVSRSEFEYSFNKNSEDKIVDKKAIDEYVQLFVNYKLKVMDAKALKMDTAAAFQKEFKGYRSQQADVYLIDNDFIEQEAQKVYEQTKESVGADGLLRVGHILVMLKQNATPQEQEAAKVRIDSIYQALSPDGGNFLNLAMNCSDDKASAQRGSFWIQRGQTYKEFENVVFALEDGKISEPFLSPAGYHIAIKYEKKDFGDYEEYHENILAFLSQRGIEKAAKLNTGKKLAEQMGNGITPEQALLVEDSLLEQKYPEFNHLMREFYEGSLCFEISSMNVWDRASKDTLGLQEFFKANKKQYKYEKPRFKGAVAYCNSEETLKKVQKRLKKEELDNYAIVLRNEFNTDSVPCVKMEKGYFVKGDNGWVDRFVFKDKTAKGKEFGELQSVGVVGKLQKKGPDTYKDVLGRVVENYQNMLDAEWIKSLRSKYSVVIDEEVVKTVNNHQ